MQPLFHLMKPQMLIRSLMVGFLRNLSLIHTVCSNKWISKGEICYGITDFPYSLPFTSHDILIDTYTDSTLEKYNEVRKCSKRLWLQRMDLTIPYKQRNMPVN